ncbi:MAG: sigma-70 family RNA polymerase sigma factor [Polyangiaceae bacterium]|nr:sigma-70 family RNA polymerase sigma factor [Polyangiaceae bacterium]
MSVSLASSKARSLHPLTKAQRGLAQNTNVASRAARIARLRSCLSFEDLRGVASVGLCVAAARFDRTRGVPFDGFAWKLIVRMLGRATGSELRHRRCQVIFEEPDDDESEEAPMPRARVASLPSAAMTRTPEEMYATREYCEKLLEALARALECLPALLRRVLEMRYGAGIEVDDIAEVLRVSSRSVRRYHSRALDLCRRQLHRRGFTSLECA